METVTKAELVPVYDEAGNIILYDIYVDNKWVGSRRTVDQCDDRVRHLSPGSKITVRTMPRPRAAMKKAYLDNNILSGRVSSDLPEIEMAALRRIERARTNGQLEVVTSRESHREQDRAKDETLRLELERDRPNISVVSDDHLLLGIRPLFDQRGNFFGNSPILTEEVDAGLLATFKEAGLKDADARHLMYAVHNGCDRFVTMDTDFLKRKPALEKSCRGLRIVKPSELETELAAMGPAT